MIGNLLILLAVTGPETMPWQNASQMNGDDLAALYMYLTTQTLIR